MRKTAALISERLSILPALLVLAVTLPDCAPPDPPADDTGPPGNPTGLSVGEHCELLMQAYCDRSSECGQTSTDCLERGREDCCASASGDCEAPSASPAANVTACENAILEAACEGLLDGELPPPCQGVVQAR